MFTLQVMYYRKVPYVVHAEYCESPQGGGHLACIYPGGSFKGFEFEKLCEMGTGKHQVAALDPYDFQNTGIAPEFQSERRAKLAHFEFVLFGYQVGAYTSQEVLAFAQDIGEAYRESEA